VTPAANRGPASFITIGCGGIRRRRLAAAAVPPAAAGLRTVIRGGWRAENAAASAVKGSRLKVIFLDSARFETEIYLFQDIKVKFLVIGKGQHSFTSNACVGRAKEE
jgi:hypothetical protein